ncbi:MAG: S9 family peptidase [Alphaproteobacteria bacterium]|nr:S9 family peptidase [Alphaproteobacteria bacterium]
MIKSCLLTCAVACSPLCGASDDGVQCPDVKKFDEQTLIPRDVLLAKPDRFCVKLSHNGKYISFFSRSEDGVKLVIISSADKKQIRSFPVISARNMYTYTWAHDNEHILLPEDNQGDENDHILCLDVRTGEKSNLTPFGKTSKSYVLKTSASFPKEILICNNKRNPQWFDTYKINILTGDCELVFQNNAYTNVLFNEKFELKVLFKTMENGDTQLFSETNNLLMTVAFEDVGVFVPYHLAKGKNLLYASHPMGKDKAALISFDLDTKEIKTLLESDEANVILSSCDPETFEPQLAEVEYLRKKDFPLTKSIQNTIDWLRSYFLQKEFYVQGRSSDDKIWLIVTQESDESVKYYLFNKDNQKIEFLFSNQPILDKYHLKKMEPIVIKSRDGFNLVCYLTRARTDRPTPMVAYIHGGPWARDSYGFDKTAQLLANRGYAVLQINYRGSEGFGKKFFNAINKNLEAVRNDIIDAVQWAIDNKIADAEKIAIMGGSFGGYSALAGLAFTPDFFCCGVDIVGPSNFITLLSSVPEYWKPSMVCWYKTAGNPDVPEDIPYLKAISPLFKKDEIKKALLVFQGKNDPRVVKAESDQIVQALKDKNRPVVYVLYPDEGHGFHKEQNIKSYIALTEKFLSKFLGGWFEPYTESDLKGSSHQILEGEELLK